jgi:hypothetical protein
MPGDGAAPTMQMARLRRRQHGHTGDAGEATWRGQARCSTSGRPSWAQESAGCSPDCPIRCPSLLHPRRDVIHERYYVATRRGAEACDMRSRRLCRRPVAGHHTHPIHRQLSMSIYSQACISRRRIGPLATRPPRVSGALTSLAGPPRLNMPPDDDNGQDRRGG